MVAFGRFEEVFQLGSIVMTLKMMVVSVDKTSFFLVRCCQSSNCLSVDPCLNIPIHIFQLKVSFSKFSNPRFLFTHTQSHIPTDIFLLNFSIPRFLSAYSYSYIPIRILLFRYSFQQAYVPIHTYSYYTFLFTRIPIHTFLLLDAQAILSFVFRDIY